VFDIPSIDGSDAGTQSVLGRRHEHAEAAGGDHTGITPQRRTPWLGISDSNFDVQSENSSL